MRRRRRIRIRRKRKEGGGGEEGKGIKEGGGEGGRGRGGGATLSVPRTSWEAGTWATAIIEEDEQEGELKGRRELKDKNQFADALFIRNRPQVMIE